MKERLLNELLACLARSGSMKEIRDAFAEVLSGYAVSIGTTDIVPYAGGVPKEVEMYIVSRSIEGMAESTAKAKVNLLRSFFASVCKPLRNIDTNAVRLWLYRYKTEHGVSDRTLETMRLHLRAFFEWCAENGLTDRNPVRGIAPIRFERKQYGYLTQEELERVRDACKSVREHMIIEMYYSTGMRCTELTTVRIQDVDIPAGTVRVHNKKGKREKICYLNGKAIYWLKRYMEEERCTDNDALLQASRAPHGPVSTSAVEWTVRKIATRAELGKRCTPMTFRHTCATQGLRAGMSLSEVQAMLDHRNPSTTMIYAEQSSDATKAAHRRAIV